ncbi:hypothetical protein AAG570_004026 [Ranatra chinensis]|uniref:Cytochrome P450 n=1 Tax=Ranatra chinensis TaxID=642074 RepID=A0ABD0Y2P5_9HEMI
MVVTVAGVIWLVGYNWKRRRTISLMAKIPGLPSLPLIGNCIEINVEHDEILTRIASTRHLWGRKYGFCKAWFAHRPYVFVSKATSLEPILGNGKFLEKSHEYTFLHQWLGTGLLTSSGHKWQTRRKILTPAFHFRILDDFLEVFWEQSCILTKILEDRGPYGETFNLFPFITLCALDIICETAMGQKVNAQISSSSEYVKAVYELSSLVQNRQAKIWLQPEWMFRLSSSFSNHRRCVRTVHEFSNRVSELKKIDIIRTLLCKQFILKINLGGKKRLAFLDLLLESSQEGKILSDEDIREEVDTFMFEGHDTTAAAIAWLLFLLSLHQDIQDRVVSELDSIFGDSLRAPRMKDLNQMKYLEQCIKEALRLYPSVPLFARKISEDVTVGPYVLPAGTSVMVVTYQLHRDPDIFPNPEAFNPDNFCPDRVQGRHPYAYIPFSAGPRNCIGQKFAILEEKVVVSSVLRKFKLEAVDRRENLTLLGELILRPKHGLSIKIYPRKL